MLPKKHRLSSLKISEILKRGKGRKGYSFAFSFALFNFVVNQPTRKPANQKTSPSQFSFVVSQKIDKRATVRNRTKRLLSEAVRFFLPKMKPGFSVLVFAKKAFKNEKLQDILPKVEEAFKKCGFFFF